MDEPKPPYFAYAVTLLPYILVGLGVLGALLYFHGPLVLLLGLLQFAGALLIVGIILAIIFLAADGYHEQSDKVKEYRHKKMWGKDQ